MLLAEIADLHTQIGAQRGNAGIIADIEGRKLLSESVAPASTHCAKSLEKPSVRKWWMLRV
jgi:hypothetical protein